MNFENYYQKLRQAAIARRSFDVHLIKEEMFLDCLLVVQLPNGRGQTGQVQRLDVLPDWPLD